METQGWRKAKYSLQDKKKQIEVLAVKHSYVSGDRKSVV